ncbi:MAG: TIGR03915 family putative DNA repair protein [Candidatus Margulisbacteria bacterium]|jgi:probable DNA metabolism protein|nr:TIGR03915 family putative DNA repair protein [Candidatus Margulisiibacteriota bacterium]
MLFVYDGSLEGFLTAVFEAYRLKIVPEIVTAENYQKGLFDEIQQITADPAKAARVSAKLRELEIFYNVQCCYLSSFPDKEKIIFNYVRKTLSAGRSLDGNYADPDIASALECLRRVAREAERLKGLLRFQELSDGSFYAACEPDHGVLPLLAGHCRARFSAQNWLIHDVRRGLALIYQDCQLNLFSAVDLQDARGKYSARESHYQELWKTFWRAVAIQERKNPKLQRQFMPKRYWKYLVEKN